MKKKFTLSLAVLLTCLGFSAIAAVGEITTDGAFYFKVIAEGEVDDSTAVQPHSVTISEDIINGIVTPNDTLACLGDTVLLVVTPEQNYELKSLVVSTQDYDVETFNIGNDYAFVMPDNDVVVYATFDSIFTYNPIAFCEQTTGGSVQVMVNDEYITPGTPIKEGELVTFHIAPNKGYELDIVNVSDSSSVENTSKYSKILVIGNSYSHDAFTYLLAVAADARPDHELLVGICMDGSQTLQGHLDKARSGGTYTRYSKCSSWGTSPFPWTVFSNNSPSNAPRPYSLAEALADEDWDLIVLHQSSDLSCDYNSITSTLQPLIDWIRGNGYTGKFGWMVIPAFCEGTSPRGINKLQTVSQLLGLDHVMSSDEMALRLLDIGHNVMLDYPDMEVLIPCGTAIQMGRKTDLAEVGEWAPEDGEPGMMLYKDGHHLQMGIANLLEAWTVFMSLTQDSYTRDYVEAPTWSNGDRMSSDRQPKGMEEDNQTLARKCASIALKNQNQPNAITTPLEELPRKTLFSFPNDHIEVTEIDFFTYSFVMPPTSVGINVVFNETTDTGNEPELLPGDLNGDGLVDVNDVSLLIDLILDKDVILADGAQPDINDDGNTDVIDVSALINIVLE